jgi:hypothetical protein
MRSREFRPRNRIEQKSLKKAGIRIDPRAKYVIHDLSGKGIKESSPERAGSSGGPAQNAGRQTFDLSGWIIKLALIAVLAVFLVLVYSRNNAKDIDLAEINDALLSGTNAQELVECDERDLLNFMNLDFNSFDSFLYYKNNEALSVEELLIIKGDDSEDISAAQDAVEKRVASQIKMFESYGPEQVKQLKNAVITKKGNYLFYCVSDDAETYEEVFLNAI